MTNLESLVGAVIPPIATPLREDGRIDAESVRELRDHLAGNGAGGVFALGSTGEAAYLTDEDRVELIRALASPAGPGPLLIGLPETTAGRVIQSARRYAEFPVAGFVVTGPFYARQSEAELYDHFALIAASVPAPVLAYDIPVNVGYKLPGSLIARLISDGVLAGIKDSSGDLAAFRALASAPHPAGTLFLTGSDELLDCALALGANGSTAGLANVAPGLFAEALAAHQADDPGRRQAAVERINQLARLYVPTEDGSGLNSVQLGSIKSALQILGIISSDQVSAPMRRSSAERRVYVRDVLAGAGIGGVSAGASRILPT